MKLMRKSLLLILLIFITQSATASRAYRTTRHLIQPDGKSVTVQLAGDEKFHYWQTRDGIPVLMGSDGAWRYATIGSGNKLVRSQLYAHEPSDRSVAENLQAMHSKASLAVQSTATTKAQRLGIGSSALAPVRSKGEVRVPVILVEFSDINFSDSCDVTFFDKHFNASHFSEGNAWGSVRDYFIMQSDSLFKPYFDVLGVVKLSHPKSYYGQNNTYGSDVNDGAMMKEALDSALAKGYNLSQYATSGIVSFTAFIYAGEGEQVSGNSTDLWAKNIFTLSHKTGGITFSAGLCTNELADYDGSGKLLPDGIGTFCHEFSHALGLPDFYSTNNLANNFGLDYWDIMDWGQFEAQGNRPVGYSAYERMFLGWLTPVTLQNVKQKVVLSPLTGSTDTRSYIIQNPNDATGNEYLILENRKSSRWFNSWYGQGMLVYHVDYLASAWTGNRVNNDRNHQRMTILPADGTLTPAVSTDSSGNYVYASKADYQGDLYPGISSNTEISDFSTPPNTAYTGQYFNRSLKQITRESNGDVTFYYQCEGQLDPVGDLSVADLGETSATLTWTANSNAVAYAISWSDSEGTSHVDTVTVSSLTIPDLQSNTSYTVNVKAIGNDNWLDSESSQVSFSTRPTSISRLEEQLGNCIVEVYTASGQKIGRYRLNGLATDVTLPRGIYLLKLGKHTIKVMK